MNFENILISKKSAIATVTINRPSKLNALNKATIKELHNALKDLDDEESIRVIILTGSGKKAFVAGADIAEFANYSAKEGVKLSSSGHKQLFSFIEKMKTPVIAAVNGYALGGGLELAMACHFRVASHNSRMGLPEVSLGVIPGYGGTQRLPQLIGKGRAMEMILGGGMIDAAKALEFGLVNHVVEQEHLMNLTVKIATEICQNSPKAIAYAIKAINAGFNHNENGYEAEIEAFGKCFGTSDFKEGTTAFLEKRKPNF
ncbi:enoyl-CoA hydratase/isomerase family protein [Arenibacter latericius]|uniref:enoyl-CoA hydratase/isomerase family protein n=1 Tax=Arenibacter latericius TaxID=86104 RepID=UPI0003FB3A81|nr:enoyl-CoA hydratase-related protein [Arenibacter latericius]MDX1364346.1 enoyl-CoA hydratase-related protein [Arenibacter latericius]